MRPSHLLKIIYGVLVLGILVGCRNTELRNKQPPHAVQGVLDLSNWNFENDGQVKLDGEWGFYWKQFLSSSDFETSPSLKPDAYAKVPGRWNDLEVDHKAVGSEGYATYRLTVSMNETAGDLAFKIPIMGTAYELEHNGQLLASSGRIGISRDLMQPSYHPTIVEIQPQSRSPWILLLRISNFHTYKGGPWYSLSLNSPERLKGEQRVSARLQWMVFGCIFIMGLYHLGLYIIRPSEKSTLYLGISCLLIALRTLLTEEKFLYGYFDETLWLFCYKVEYLTYYLSVFVFVLFGQSVFPRQFSNKIVRPICGIGVLASLLVVLTPPWIYTYSLSAYHLFTLFVMLYVILSVSMACWKKEENGGWFLAGLLIFAMAIINDILYTKLLIRTVTMASYGLVGFLFAQSMMLSVRFSKAFLQVAQFGEHLENKVAERTLQLELRNEELQRTRIQKSEFEKFVPQQFLKRVETGEVNHFELGKAESAVVTVLFSDIRSFISLSEGLEPQEVLNFLNAYFLRMSVPIEQNLGFVDKFIGDAIMAVFDIPDTSTLVRAACAVDAAIGMQNALTVYNQHRRKVGYSPIQTGIGIHSGNVVIGTVGTQSRMDTTVLGDTVNLAARLESLSKHYNASILISSEIVRMLTHTWNYQLRELDLVRVKGRRQPVGVYEVFDTDLPEVLHSKKGSSPWLSEGLLAIQHRKWQEALSLFEKALQIYPDDVVAQQHIQRCRFYQVNPPPEDWDGAWILDRK
ncbi:adenylate/guanylate cyclase domain-containing protein [Deltaproteobacteria bacterium TL4]